MIFFPNAFLGAGFILAGVVMASIFQSNKWEKKELTQAEWQILSKAGKARKGTLTSEGKIIAEVKVEQLTEKTEQKMPQEEEVDFDKVPAQVEYEIIRDEGAIIKRGKVKKFDELKFIRSFKPFPRAYFSNHVIKIISYDRKGNPRKPRFVVRFNEYYAEALDLTHSIIPAFAQELSNLLLADWMIQRKNALGKVGLQIDMNFLKVLAVGFGFAIPLGLFLDGLWGLIPTTVIHWVPG